MISIRPVLYRVGTALQNVLGGGTRGPGAVDMQYTRSASTQVASGEYSVIAGGRYNTATGGHSAVLGGYKNTADAPYAIAAGLGAQTCYNQVPHIVLSTSWLEEPGNSQLIVATMTAQGGLNPNSYIALKPSTTAGGVNLRMPEGSMWLLRALIVGGVESDSGLTQDSYGFELTCQLVRVVGEVSTPYKKHESYTSFYRYQNGVSPTIETLSAGEIELRVQADGTVTGAWTRWTATVLITHVNK